MSQPEPRTLGWLISTLRWYEELKAEIDTFADAVEYGSAEALYRLEKYADRDRLDLALGTAAGIDRVRLLCEELDNDQGFTAANVRKLRAKVYRAKHCLPEAADALSLDEAVDAIDPNVPRNHGRGSSEELLDRLEVSGTPKDSVRYGRELLRRNPNATVAEVIGVMEAAGVSGGTIDKARGLVSDLGKPVSLLAVAARLDNVRAINDPDYRARFLNSVPEWPLVRYACERLFHLAGQVRSEDVRRLVDAIRFEAGREDAGDAPLADVAPQVQALLSGEGKGARGATIPSPGIGAPDNTTKKALAALLLIRPTSSEGAVWVDTLFSQLREEGHRETSLRVALFELKDAGLVAVEERVYHSPPPDSLIANAPEGVFLTTEPRPEPSEMRYQVVWPLPGLHQWWRDQAEARQSAGIGVPRDHDGAGQGEGAAKKPRRSTEQGEARAKIIPALTKHHRYGEGGVVNQEPIGVRDLAKLANVSKDSVSSFFKKEFGSHARYRAACRQGSAGLSLWLKLHNGEYSPHPLFGAAPPGEGSAAEE